MAAVAIFCVPRDKKSALVNPVDRFLDELYVKTRVLAKEVTCGGSGFRNIFVGISMRFLAELIDK